MHLAARITIIAILLVGPACSQRVVDGYVFIEGERNRKIGYIEKNLIYEKDWTEAGIHTAIARYDTERLELSDLLGSKTYYAVVALEDGTERILFMKWAGVSLGFSDLLLIDVFDSDFQFVKSGEVYGPINSTPYAVAYANSSSEQLPETFKDTWRMCIAFARSPIDPQKTVTITSRENRNNIENDAQIAYIEWDGDPVRLPRRGSAIGGPGLPQVKSAELGLSISSDGTLIIPENRNTQFFD